MIINFDLKSKDYFQKIDSINLDKYTCPNSECEAESQFVRHGYYERNNISIKNEEINYSKIKILRVKCKSCGKTHAILPGDIIPYKQFNYSSFLEILKSYFCNSKSGYELSKKFNVSFQTIYDFINTFLIFKNSAFVIIKIMNIIDELFSKDPSFLLDFIVNKIGFFKFIKRFSFFNQWPFLMEKFRNNTSNHISIGFFKT